MMVFAASASLVGCDKDAQLVEERAPAELEQTVVLDENIMGFTAPVVVYVDGELTELKHSEVQGEEFTLDYVPQREADGSVSEVAVFAFTDRETREAWGDDNGYNIRERNAFIDRVHGYVRENNLPDDPDLLTDQQIDAYERFEREAFAETVGFSGEIAARGTGLLSRDCGPGGGALQVINTKPFISQSSWRSVISAYDGVVGIGVIKFGLQVWGKSWYRKGKGTYWETVGTELCLEGTAGDNQAKSLTAY